VGSDGLAEVRPLLGPVLPTSGRRPRQVSRNSNRPAATLRRQHLGRPDAYVDHDVVYPARLDEVFWQVLALVDGSLLQPSSEVWRLPHLAWHDLMLVWYLQVERTTLRFGGLGMVEIAPRIVVDETIKFGKPIIQGTRVPVDLVLGKLAGGMTIDEVMDEYDLTREDVLAVLSYAARSIAGDEVRAVRR